MTAKMSQVENSLQQDNRWVDFLDLRNQKYLCFYTESDTLYNKILTSNGTKHQSSGTIRVYSDALEIFIAKRTKHSKVHFIGKKQVYN